MLGQGSICPEQKKKVYWPSKASKEKKKPLCFIQSPYTDICG